MRVIVIERHMMQSVFFSVLFFFW